MVRRLPPLNALRAFETAGRRRSFVGAAKELNVSHAAVSRHVRGLEARLGVQLFRTLPRGVALTEAGETYLAETSKALDLIAAATDRLTAGVRRRVSVSAEPTFALRWLAANLGDFHAGNPEVEVVVDASAEIADLRSGEWDVSIRWARGEMREPGAALISNHPAYPVASRAFADRLTLPVSPEQMQSLALLHEDSGAIWRRWFAAAGLVNPALRERTGRFGSLMTIEAALAGQGVALSSAELVAKDVAEGRLVRLNEIGVAFGGYHVVLTPGAAPHGPAARFRDWLLEATRMLRAG